MNKIGNQFASIEQIAGQYLHTSQTRYEKEQTSSFEQILNEKQSKETVSELKFSKHASMRLESRNISLTEEQNKRLENGVKKAGEKGISESLVLVDTLAFIVNIPNKTVVTAMDQAETQENIFTNIDGAVVI